MHFGEHITIDGYGGDYNLLNSEEVVFSCLNNLPGELGMKKLSEPLVYHSEGNNIKDPGGWTGFVIIEESHISIHTFAKRGFVSADVYTCQNGLDQERIVKYFREIFRLDDIEINFIIRGEKYPENNIYD